jgi:hypothetical protein
MHKTNFLEQKILEHLFKDEAYSAPANTYVALYAVPTWQASTAYSAGQYVIPTTFNGAGPRRLYRCTTAGTSGSSEPSWPTSDGGTVTDGSVTWTEATPTIESGTNLPNEVSGGGYSRQAIAADTGWGAITDETSGGGKYVANSADVDFGTATADWGQIPLAILWDAASAGNPLYYVVLDQAKTVQNGDPVKFAAGTLTVAER